MSSSERRPSALLRLSARSLARRDPLSMGALAVGLLLVPLAERALKLALGPGLGPRSVPLGGVGALRMVKTHIWLARRRRRPSPAGIWIVWLLAAGAVALLSARIPSCGWFAGLLL